MSSLCFRLLHRQLIWPPFRSLDNERPIGSHVGFLSLKLDELASAVSLPALINRAARQNCQRYFRFALLCSALLLSAPNDCTLIHLAPRINWFELADLSGSEPMNRAEAERTSANKLVFVCESSQLNGSGRGGKQSGVRCCWDPRCCWIPFC